MCNQDVDTGVRSEVHRIPDGILGGQRNMIMRVFAYIAEEVKTVKKAIIILH